TFQMPQPGLAAAHDRSPASTHSDARSFQCSRFVLTCFGASSMVRAILPLERQYAKLSTRRTSAHVTLPLVQRCMLCNHASRARLRTTGPEGAEVAGDTPRAGERHGGARARARP